MKPIKNTQDVKFRSGLQVERDQAVVQIAIFTQDLFDNIQKRKLGKVQLLTTGDVNLLTSLVRKLASAHFYLKYENAWLSAQPQKREVMYRLTVEHILKLIVKNNMPIANELALSVTNILEDKYRKVFNPNA